MKNKIVSIGLTLVSILSSCSLEEKMENSWSSDGLVSTKIEIPDVSTRRILNPETLSQAWEEGDEIEIRGYFKDGSDVYHNTDFTLVASAEGPDMVFSGKLHPDLELYPSSTLFALSPSGCVSGFNKNSISIVVEDTQTGTVADFGKYGICYSSTTFKLNNGALPSSIKMKNLLPVIHFTVEKDLDINSIEIKGFDKASGDQIPFSGKISFKPGRMGMYSVSGSASKSLTISRGGAEISGDVFACIMPDYPTRYNNGGYYSGSDAPTMDDGNLRGRSCADSLLFIFSTISGNSSQFGASITPSSLLSGSVKQLGSVKKLPADSLLFEMSFKDDVQDPTIICTSTLGSKVRYYLTSSTVDFGSVPTPSESDEEITESGLVLSQMTKHDSLYIKVMACCEGYEKTYMRAFVRNWHFGKSYDDLGGTCYTGTNIADFPLYYYGLTFSSHPVTNKDWSSRFSLPRSSTVTTQASFGGKGAMFLVGSASGGTTVKFNIAGIQCGEKSFTCKSANPASAASSVSPIAKGENFVWTSVSSTQVPLLTCLEQSYIVPFEMVFNTGIEEIGSETPYNP